MQNQRQRHLTRALKTLRVDICNDLIVDYVINHLVDTRVFTEEERLSILRSGQSIGDVNDLLVRDQVLRAQNEYFLDLLVKKIEKIDFAFNSFSYILFNTYEWIAKRILFLVDEYKRSDELNNNLTEIEIKAEKKLNVCHDVPNKVRNLLKRSNKLDEIRHQLVQFGERGRGWLIVSGMGGSGKSILAAEAVRDWNCDHYSDGIWWTNCGLMTKDNKFDESMLLLKMQFLWEKICDQFPTKYLKFEGIESAVFRLKSHFKTHRKSLIVLDDVWNKEVLENFEIGVPILVTTRDRSTVPFRFEDVRYLQTIDDNDYGLSVAESRELLALWVKCSPQELNEDYVNRIIEKLKGNPLCLTLIGNVMEEKGNNAKLWKYYFESIENSSEKSSPVRRRSSSGTRNIVYNSLGFDTLVRHSYEDLNQDLREYFKYFALFLEDMRIPIEVFQLIWGMDECGVEIIMDKLVKKSLVIVLKTNGFTLYMVHDIILNFLKNQCKHELESLHSELVDSYCDLCRKGDEYDYSLLPRDGYIYYFLGYHIYKSNRPYLFADVFLDLSFVVNKIRYTGPSDLLNDYVNYKEHFKQSSDRYQDFVRFVSTNADLLCDLNIDVLQLALCQSNDSEVYKSGLQLVKNSNKIYLKWCNQSNVKSSKLLSTKLHSGAVRFAVFVPNKNLIVSVGSDKLVKIWDSKTGKQIRTMKGHLSAINCCQFSCDENCVITASDDGTVKVWHLETDDLFFNYLELSSPRPRSGSEYPYICNGNIMIDDSSGTYREHSIENIEDTQTEVKCCAFSTRKPIQVVSGGSDKCLHIWSLNDLKTQHILRGHNYSITSCQFSSDSEFIISASGDEVMVWSWREGSRVRTLKHAMNVENCVFGTDLNYIFTSSGRYVYKWSSSGERVCQYNNIKTEYYVTHCTVSPNGEYIGAGTTTDQIVIWTPRSFKTLAAATFKCTDRINCINFNSDSTKLLSACDDGTVIIWDTSQTFGASMVALRKKFSVQNNRKDIKVLTPDENGKIRLFEGIEGKEDRLFPLRSKEVNEDTYNITCCALSKEMDILFGTSDGKLILYLTAGNETRLLPKHELEVTFCAFIDGKNKFVSASKDATFRTFNKFLGTYETPKWEVESERSDRLGVKMGPIVNCKLFSQSNKAMIWCENGSLFVVDLRANTLIACCGQESQINFADITANEQLIATVCSDNSVKLWRSFLGDRSASEKNEIYFIRHERSSDCPRSCRFSPKGDFLAIGDDTGNIKIWNFNGSDSLGKHLQNFEDTHSGWVNDIAIAPEGNLIITIGKSIKLWNRNGALLQTFKTNGGSMSSIYTHFVETEPNSDDTNHFNKIVTVDEAGVLYILHILNFHLSTNTIKD